MREQAVEEFRKTFGLTPPSDWSTERLIKAVELYNANKKKNEQREN